MECFLLIICEAFGLGYWEWKGKAHTEQGMEHWQAEPGVPAAREDPGGLGSMVLELLSWF